MDEHAMTPDEVGMAFGHLAERREFVDAGSRIVVKPFKPWDGECGYVDVVFPGGHVEFKVTQTGWGRALQPEEAPDD
jgi:hypothetical protein